MAGVGLGVVAEQQTVAQTEEATKRRVKPKTSSAVEEQSKEQKSDESA